MIKTSASKIKTYSDKIKAEAEKFKNAIIDEISRT